MPGILVSVVRAYDEAVALVVYRVLVTASDAGETTMGPARPRDRKSR